MERSKKRFHLILGELCQFGSDSCQECIPKFYMQTKVGLSDIESGNDVH